MSPEIRRIFDHLERMSIHYDKHQPTVREITVKQAVYDKIANYKKLGEVPHIVPTVHGLLYRSRKLRVSE